MKKISIILAILMVIILMVTGCSAKYSSNKSLNKEEHMNDELGEGFAPPSENNSDKENGKQGDDLDRAPGNKIIKKGYMEVETLNFDQTTKAITERVKEIGGFIESSNVYGKSKFSRGDNLREAVYTLRIPSKSFEQFMTDVGELGNVLRTQNTGENISEAYYDTEARVKSLEIQEERLLDILKDADKLSDVIELERELSKVRYEIEQHTGALKKWDSLVEFSTLELSLYEVKELDEEDPTTIWQKISKGFKASLKNVIKFLEFMFIFILSSLPYFVLLGAIALLVIFILRLFLKKNK